MKVQVLSLTEKALEEREYRDILQINVDGVKAFGVMDGEPEDSNLGRDFSDCWKVTELMEKAYKAGVKGEKFEIEREELEEI